MLSVNVASQVNFALKRPVLTDVTGERLESGVLTTVSDQVRRLTERFAALTTCVGLLAFITTHQSYLNVTDGRTDGQTDRQTDRRLTDAIA